jgi:AAA+ ATPase superfamily predicted ATPase
MMFVGRRAELALLEAAYRGKASALIPIYGRRRVGKSELILRFLAGKPSLYFLGKTAPAAVQLREFLQEAARVLDEPLLTQVTVEGWGQALSLLSERWKRSEKLVLVLDEFQWTAAASPELPSVLQELWDRRWKRAANVVVILCGSFVGFMEREVLGKGSPLFGRRTAQIRLAPFGYREAAEFLPGWSLEDRALAYFILGGVPFYLACLDPSLSLDTNIERNFLTEFAPLYREPEFLLREELRDVESYHAVLLAIAAGNTTNRTIAPASGLPERSLHYYIEQLVELGYVARRYPLTSERPIRRNVRYVLEDSLLRFWFRFIFPNLSFIQQAGPRRAFRERIRGELDAYAGLCFEKFAREALSVLYEKEGVSAGWTVGEFWGKGVQIDVVGLRDDRWTDLGECKWGPVSSTRGLVEELAAKVGRYPNRRGATIGQRFFVKKLPQAKLPESPVVRWHSLADLYGA